MFLVSCHQGEDGSETDLTDVSSGKATLRNVDASGKVLNVLAEMTGNFGKMGHESTAPPVAVHQRHEPSSLTYELQV